MGGNVKIKGEGKKDKEFIMDASNIFVIYRKECSGHLSMGGGKGGGGARGYFLFCLAEIT